MSQTKSTPIKMPGHVSEKLSNLEKRRNIFQCVGIALVCISIVIIGIASYQTLALDSISVLALDFISVESLRVMLAICAGIIGGYPMMYCFYNLSMMLESRCFPDFYIEEDQNILKLWGSYRIMDSRYVKSKMLAMRPGYVIVDDAYARFGCTMAAVPANKLVDRPA